jgi:hypothetical protein
VCQRKFASSGNLSAHRRKVHKLTPIPHNMQSRRHMLEEQTKQPPATPGSLSPNMAATLSVTSPHAEILTVLAQNPQIPFPVGVPVPAHQIHLPKTTLDTASIAIAHQGVVASAADVVTAVAQATAMVYQPALITKFEPAGTKAESYAQQQAAPDDQQETAVPIYWPNTAYGESQ